MLNINPKVQPRVDEIEDDLLARGTRAEQQSWLGEVEGIALRLQFVLAERDAIPRIAQTTPTDPVMLQFASATCP